MYKNNLIAEKKITTSSMFKNLCCCSATISDLYDGKSKKLMDANKSILSFTENHFKTCLKA